MSDSNAIGDRIRKLREEKDLTQLGLAQALKKEFGFTVKRETINQWENGARDLKTDYTIILAKFFNQTCDYILRGVEAENMSIHEKTGLSNDAISALTKLSNKKIQKGTETLINGSDVLNELFTNDSFQGLIENIVRAAVTRKRRELTPIDPDDYSKLRYLEMRADDNDVLFAEWKIEHFVKDWALSVFNAFYNKQEATLEKVIYEWEDEYEEYFGNSASAPIEKEV